MLTWGTYAKFSRESGNSCSDYFLKWGFVVLESGQQVQTRADLQINPVHYITNTTYASYLKIDKPCLQTHQTTYASCLNAKPDALDIFA